MFTSADMDEMGRDLRQAGLSVEQAARRSSEALSARRESIEHALHLVGSASSEAVSEAADKAGHSARKAALGAAGAVEDASAKAASALKRRSTKAKQKASAVAHKAGDVPAAARTTALMHIVDISLHRVGRVLLTAKRVCTMLEPHGITCGMLAAHLGPNPDPNPNPP